MNNKEYNMKDSSWIPKKYRERVQSLEMENDLIDDCKYILYFNEDWCWSEDYQSIPVRSKKEALHFIKEARLKTEEMESKGE